jgi:hypothetical protein
LPAFGAELVRIKFQITKEFEQTVDLTFQRIVFVHYSYFHIAEQAVAGFEIAFFVAQVVLCFGKQTFQLVQKMGGVFDLHPPVNLFFSDVFLNYSNQLVVIERFWNETVDAGFLELLDGVVHGVSGDGYNRHVG